MYYNNLFEIVIFGADEGDLARIFPLFWIVLIAVLIIILIALAVTKNSDNKKPSQSRKAKILEKALSQGNTEWYTVEFENGERMKLRNLNANRLILSVGDIGLIEFRGKTIYSFINEKSGLNNNKNQFFAEGSNQVNNFWYCPSCGMKNTSSVRNCVNCGSGSIQGRSNTFKDSAKKIPEQVVGPDEWRCPKCGRVNKNYVGTCGCGEQKTN